MASTSNALSLNQQLLAPELSMARQDLQVCGYHPDPELAVPNLFLAVLTWGTQRNSQVLGPIHMSKLCPFSWGQHTPSPNIL